VKEIWIRDYFEGEDEVPWVLMDGGEPCWFFIFSYGSLGVGENFVRKDFVLE
jgi:hypothetical protein